MRENERRRHAPRAIPQQGHAAQSPKERNGADEMPASYEQEIELPHQRDDEPGGMKRLLHVVGGEGGVAEPMTGEVMQRPEPDE